MNDTVTKAVTGLVLATSATLAVLSRTKAASTTAGVAASHQYPSDVIPTLGTSLFKLTLPVDKDGGDSRDSTNLAGRNNNVWDVVGIFLGDFEYKPYFWAENDEVVFRAHCGGATTSGSNYPRCEMRQRAGNGDNTFLTKDANAMEIECRITLAPVNKPELIVMQIHAADEENGGQPLSVVYSGDTGRGIYFLYNEDYKTEDDAMPYTLGDRLNINTTVDNSIIACDITNLDTGDERRIRFTSAFQSGYWKMGVYTLATIHQNEYQGGSTVDELPDSAGEVRFKFIKFATTTFDREDPDHDTLTDPPATIPPGLLTPL